MTQLTFHKGLFQVCNDAALTKAADEEAGGIAVSSNDELLLLERY